jgi:hypothetical protein
VNAVGDFILEGGVSQAKCPKGSYCVEGVITTCSDGTFCPEGSFVSDSCARGSFCPNPGEEHACTPGGMLSIGSCHTFFGCAFYSRALFISAPPHYFGLFLFDAFKMVISRSETGHWCFDSPQCTVLQGPSSQNHVRKVPHAQSLLLQV